MKNSLKCIIGLSRPLGWKAYLWMTIIGYIDGAKSITFNPLFAYTIVSYLAMTFAVNDLFDVDSDSSNPSKNNPLCSRRCDRKHVIILLANHILAVLCLYVLNLSMFMLYTFMSCLAIAYSVPPIRLKSRSFFDVVSHALFFGGLLYLYGYFMGGGEIHLLNWAKPILLSLYSIFLQLRNLRDDRMYDMAAGDHTTAVAHPEASRLTLILAGSLLTAFSTAHLLSCAIPLTSIIFLVSFFLGYKFGWERFIDCLFVVSLTLSSWWSL